MAHPLRSLLLLAYFSTGLLFGALTGHSERLEATTKSSSFPSKIPLPKPMKPIHHSCYCVGYDTRNKNASWVYERLTLDGLEGSISRDHCQFKEDNVIPNIFRATLQDYKGSGFDRGHLAPAANHKVSSLEMEETFYLSNVAPQNPQFNRGYWSKLEKHVRDLTNHYLFVHVYTGPLYLPKQELDGSKWVKYRVIGENNVGVPTHFFKILAMEKSNGDITWEGYVLPNEPINSQMPIKNFRTSIEKIEKASGIIFQNINRD
jgi:endonuclease G